MLICHHSRFVTGQGETISTDLDFDLLRNTWYIGFSGIIFRNCDKIDTVYKLKCTLIDRTRNVNRFCDPDVLHTFAIKVHPDTRHTFVPLCANQLFKITNQSVPVKFDLRAISTLEAINASTIVDIHYAIYKG